MLALVTSSSSIAEAKVPTKAIKKAGRTTTAVRVNTLLNGIGAPSAKLGNEGDFYIDTVGMNIYGPKEKSAWPLPKSLIGPQGPVGVAGKPGVNGKDGRDGVNGKDGERGAAGAAGVSGGGGVGPQGPAGPAGPTGPQGPAGVAGAQGLPGVAGSNGATGAQGLPGPAGAQGAQGIQGEVGPRGLQGIQGEPGANGSAGAKGDTGAQGIQGEIGPRGLQGVQGIQGIQGEVGPTGTAGAKGDTGAQGLPGAKGDTGAQGIAGPVKALFGDIIFAGKLSGTAGTSLNSSSFSSLQTGKRYLVRAEVYANSEGTTDPSLRATLSAAGASITPTSKFVSNSGISFRNGNDYLEYGISLLGIVDGSAIVGPDYGLVITITCNTGTSGPFFGLNLNGHFLIEEVSSIN